MTTTRVAGAVPVGVLVLVAVPGALVEDAAVEDVVVGGAVVEPVAGVVDVVGADVPDVFDGAALLETGDPVVVLVIPVPALVAVSPLDWHAVSVVAVRAAASRPIGAS